MNINIKRYDNKKIRLEDLEGNQFEGIAIYDGKEYNELEYGRREESLTLSQNIFYRSEIKKVVCIKEYSSSYGKLEETVLEAGIDLIEEVLDSEEEDSVYRMLCCLEEKYFCLAKSDQTKLYDILNTIIKYSNKKEIKEKARLLIEKGKQYER